MIKKKIMVDHAIKILPCLNLMMVYHLEIFKPKATKRPG